MGYDRKFNVISLLKQEDLTLFYRSEQEGEQMYKLRALLSLEIVGYMNRPEFEKKKSIRI